MEVMTKLKRYSTTRVTGFTIIRHIISKDFVPVSLTFPTLSSDPPVVPFPSRTDTAVLL